MSVIFVTGATGVLGRGVVPLLVAAGHAVRGVARTSEKAAQLRAGGAEPVAVDLFDGEAVKAATAGAGTILHLATSIPPLSHARRRGAWADNDRLRAETTRLLVDAALTHGAEALVAESITFGYADGADRLLEEDSATDPGELLASVAELEHQVARFTDAGGRGIALRFGLFYGPDARSTDEALSLARRGVAFTLGAPGSYLSPLHTDDAASAVVAALAAPVGIYNVVDDEPCTRRVFNDGFTAAFGLRRARFLPSSVTRVAGGPGAAILMRSQRVSNRRFREAIGWAPRHPDSRAGWQVIAAARGSGRP